MANAGGVVCSYFEWVQNLQHFRWSEREVNDKLGGIMRRAYRDVSARAKEERISLREARLPGRESREWSRRAARAGTCEGARLARPDNSLEVEVLGRALLEPEVLLPLVLLVGLLGIEVAALVDLVVLERRPDLRARLLGGGSVPETGSSVYGSSSSR